MILCNLLARWVSHRRREARVREALADYATVQAAQDAIWPANGTVFMSRCPECGYLWWWRNDDEGRRSCQEAMEAHLRRFCPAVL